jgi:hypothetical protein
MSATTNFYKYLVNPIMLRLLRSPLHGITSRNIAILHFTGKKSGRALSTPLSYTREGSKVRLLSSVDTRWWRNFRGADAPVEVEIARRRYSGTAHLLEGDSAELREGVGHFINALPRDAMVYGLKLDSDKKLVESSLDPVAQRLILVEVSLVESPA